jgi:tetratricopeptide (TPR) repeat protein
MLESVAMPPALLRTLALAFALVALPCFAFDEPNLLKDVPKLISTGKLDDAERIVDRVIAADPKSAAARFQKSILLNERGKTDEAIKLLQELTAEYPELPEPYNNLGVLYAAKGRYDDARFAFESAIRADPGGVSPLTYENLGDLFLKLADQEYEKGMKLDPKNQALQTKRNTIKGLVLPAKPVQSVKSAESAKPAEAAKPADGARPAEPQKPAQPAAEPKPTASH